MEAYKEAEKIDLQINSLLKTYPVEDFAMDWAKFTRTVKSTLSIVEADALEIVREVISR